MPVEQKHRDLTKINRKYILIDDVLGGQDAVKARTTAYLPPPNDIPYKKAGANDRYVSYLDRAVFYAVTRHTLDGFVGEIFSKDPIEEFPTQLDVLKLDATGDGVSLNQLAKKACSIVLSKGRAGLFIDFPNTSGPTTAETEDDNKPIFTVYDGSKIINWRTKRFGSKLLVTLVVLEEEYESKQDEFSSTFSKRYRVLRLSDDRVYSVQVYEGATVHAAVQPKKGNGETFDYIPFLFIGSETNDVSVDYPPVYDLCQLNLAHYRNSADYEESAYLVGQPTPVFTGLSEAWVDKYFEDGIYFGSRKAVPLPEGATADLLTVEGNTLIGEAMDKKERQMVALGAKLVEQKEVQRTATEAGAEIAAQKSTLSTVADNVSQAFVEGLRCAADYVNVPSDNIVYKLNNEFAINLSTPDAANSAVSLWTQQAISFTEMRQVTRRAGFATQEDDEAEKEISAAQEITLANEVKRMQALEPLEPEPGADE